jgi:uncharacterized membrane protein
MAGQRVGRAIGWAGALLLISVIMVFFVIRVTEDVTNIGSGVLPPEDDFSRRYAENPVLAYLHILPGVVYLLIAPFQVSVRVRSRSFRRHRILGRIALTAGLLTGVFAIAVGLVMPYGRLAEATSSVVFGSYFVVALSLAVRAIRGGRVATHRRWMIRAFAVGIGVGLIRIIIGILEGFGVMTLEESFGLAFWLAFVIMAVVAEGWLRWRPAPYA